jgi:nitrate reductase gamma subunit
MYNFACCLFSNLVLLAVVQLACWFIRAMRPDLSVRGERVFIGMMVIAGVFDAALTFLVFAEASGPWQVYHPVSAFFARCLAYAIAVAVALILARRATRRSERNTNEPSQDGALVIETSPYSKSTLPM